MTWEELFLEILNMTPEQRKLNVKVVDVDSSWIDEYNCKIVNEVYVNSLDTSKVRLVIS